MTSQPLLRKPFRYAYWNVTLIIIGINIGVYLLCRMNYRIISYLAMNPFNLVNFRMYWQIITYAFVHDISSIQHLLFNMLGLLFFGIPVEKAIGSKEFLLMYLLSGLFCGIASLLIYLASGAFGVFLYGASGCLYAVLLVYAVIYPRAQIFIWGILPIPAPLLIAAYAGIEIADQLLSVKTGVAHMTHIAGFAFAWLYLVIRMNVHPWRVWKNAYR